MVAENWSVFISKSILIAKMPILCNSRFSFTVSLLDKMYTFELKRAQRPINLALLSPCAYLHIHVLVYTYSQANETTEMTLKTKKTILFSLWASLLLVRTCPRLSKIFAWEKFQFCSNFLSRVIFINAENHSSVARSTANWFPLPVTNMWPRFRRVWRLEI